MASGMDLWFSSLKVKFQVTLCHFTHKTLMSGLGPSEDLVGLQPVMDTVKDNSHLPENIEGFWNVHHLSLKYFHEKLI
jgi:hypothetical protein